MLILHSWVSPGHPELEIYARNVGLEIEKLGLYGIIVCESPAERNFAKLLREYDANWVLDLHSDVTEPYWVMKNGKWTRVLPYPYVKRSRLPRVCEIEPTDYSDLIQEPYPIAKILYGGNVWDPDVELDMSSIKPRNWIGEMLVQFSLKKYGVKDAFVPSASYPVRRYERLITFGLIYARPLNVSVDLIKSLAKHLYERF